MSDADGWNLYSLDDDMARMHVLDDTATPWRIVTNDRYTLCSTYPTRIIVPKSLTDTAIERVKSFRSRARIPSLVYRHYNGSVILRSAQPRVGLTFGRCREDEHLLELARVRVIIDVHTHTHTHIYSHYLRTYIVYAFLHTPTYIHACMCVYSHC